MSTGMDSTVNKAYPDFEHIQQIVTNAWNTKYLSQLRRNGVRRPIITPFRAVNNSGDLMSRANYTCGGSCQGQSRPGLKGLAHRFGAIQRTCVPGAAYNSLQLMSDIPAAACNVKYVYDSSDYATYLKQKATMKNRPRR